MLARSLVIAVIAAGKAAVVLWILGAGAALVALVAAALAVLIVGQASRQA